MKLIPTLLALFALSVSTLAQVSGPPFLDPNEPNLQDRLDALAPCEDGWSRDMDCLAAWVQEWEIDIANAKATAKAAWLSEHARHRAELQNILAAEIATLQAVAECLAAAETPEQIEECESVAEAMAEYYTDQRAAERARNNAAKAAITTAYNAEVGLADLSLSLCAALCCVEDPLWVK